MRFGIAGLVIVAALGVVSANCGGHSDPPGTREIFVVMSENMSPRLKISQRVEFDMDAYKTGAPQVGDIVLIHPPRGAGLGRCGSPRQPGPGQLCVKPFGGPDPESLRFIMRVVAVGGDRVSLRRGRVVRNGKLERRRGLSACTLDEACTFQRTITVPAGHVYLARRQPALLRRQSLLGRGADRPGARAATCGPSAAHQADDAGTRRREDVQGGAALRAGDAAVLDVGRDHDAVAGVHHPGLAADRERELAGQDDRDLLLEVVVHRGRGVGLEGDEVRHHAVGGHRPELQARQGDTTGRDR